MVNLPYCNRHVVSDLTPTAHKKKEKKRKDGQRTNSKLKKEKENRETKRREDTETFFVSDSLKRQLEQYLVR